MRKGTRGQHKGNFSNRKRVRATSSVKLDRLLRPVQPLKFTRGGATPKTKENGNE